MSSSIRKIALETGLSTATVSLALRGTGRISKSTREKVRKMADKLGYHAHPLLSRAFSLARQPDTKRYRETLAFLVEWETKTGPAHQKEIHSGATEQAANMGYKLEPFIVSGKPSDQRQLSRILHARGIRGIIIIPRLGHPQPRMHFEWSHFAPVEIARTLWHPRTLHHVETAAYPATIEAFHLLKKAGYRRIGMAVEPAQNRHQNGIYYASYLSVQQRLPARQRLPILSPWNEKSFRRWIEQNQPEVLFIHGRVLEVIQGWLDKMGLRVPKDISLFGTNVLDHKHLTGLRRDYVRMGRSAVEMASLLLESGEFGISRTPRCWLVEEYWQAGRTLSRPISHFISPEGFLQPSELGRHRLH